MSILHEVAKKLQALGLGVYEDGGTIIVGDLPETPSACCAVLPYGGIPGVKGIGSAAIRYETPAVQVVFRGVPDDYDGPDSKAQLAYLGLGAVMTETLVGDVSQAFYHWIQAAPPVKIKKDDSGRFHIGVSLLAEKEPSIPL